MDKRAWGLFSLVPITVGLYVMLGWLLHKPTMVQFSPESGYVFFNTAFCFVLGGLGLIMSVSENQQLKNWQIIFGFIIFVVGSLTIAQDVFKIDLGVDQFFIKDWLASPLDPHPGRMSQNSMIALTGTGFILFAMPFARYKPIGVLIDVLLFLVLFSVILRITGLALDIQFLYGLHSKKMSYVSGLCFLFLCVGLWGVWRNQPLARSLYQGSEDYKIILLSSAILVAMALAVTMTIVASLVKEQTRVQAIQNANRQLLNANYFAEQINELLDRVGSLKNNNLLKKDLLQSNMTAPEVEDAVRLLQDQGFNAVIVKKNNKIVLQKGVMISQATLLVTERLAENVINIFWKDKWFARITLKIPNSSQNIEITLQAPLENISKFLEKNRSPGMSGDYMVCSASTENSATCFDSKDQATHQVPFKISGEYLPTYYGFKENQGTKVTMDSHLHKVLASYGKIPGLPLVLISEIDLEEIYAPIAKSVRTIIPVFILAVFVGLVLLRIQVLPLVRRVINAEKELLRSNKRLKNSDERYALAVRGSNSGLWDWNIVNEEVFYSPYFKGMLGYTESEFPNVLESFYKVLHPDDFKRIQLAVEEHLINHIPYEIEYRLRRKSGDYHWFKAVGQALWDEEENPVRMAGSITDITERKRAERRLAAQYQVTKLISEAKNLEEVSDRILMVLCEEMEWDMGAFWMVDREAKSIRNTHFVTLSSQSAKAFEEKSKTLVLKKGVGAPGRVWETGQHLWIYDLAVEKNFPRAPEAIAGELKSLFSFPILMQHVVLGCMEFYSREQNPPDEALLNMMSALANQIGQFMQRKHAEMALRENEKYKTAILEAASDCILTIDVSGMIISCNSKTTETFGYTTHDLLKKSIDNLVPELTTHLVEMVGHAAREFVGRNKKHETFPVEVSLSKMTYENKKIFACIMRDITERKKVEKLKNEFVSVVSHELRTPLTSIRGSLGLLLGGKLGDFTEKARMLLEIANTNCDRLLLLINDILDVEKIEAGRMEFQFKEIDLSQLLEESLASNKMYAERLDVKLTLRNEAPGVVIDSDPDRLAQVLANLISNAAKFSPAKSEVVIKAEDLGKSIRISVIDKGPGIPEDFRKHIFKKFSQADSSSARGHGGTGLGLSITKALVENLGGKIGYESVEGKGATFYFEIPKLPSKRKSK